MERSTCDGIRYFYYQNECWFMKWESTLQMLFRQSCFLAPARAMEGLWRASRVRSFQNSSTRSLLRESVCHLVWLKSPYWKGCIAKACLVEWNLNTCKQSSSWQDEQLIITCYIISFNSIFVFVFWTQHFITHFLGCGRQLPVHRPAPLVSHDNVLLGIESNWSTGIV